LSDEPRPGRPRTITDEQVDAVIVKTLESAPPDATHWSTRSMGPGGGRLTQSAVLRIWRAFGLQTLDRDVPEHLDVHLVLENSSTHKTPAIQPWLILPPPVRAPFHAELFPLAEPRRALLRRVAHRSVPQLSNEIRAWIATCNDEPRPYVWTKTAR
jgi:hypothetical protein